MLHPMEKSALENSKVRVRYQPSPPTMGVMGAWENPKTTVWG